MAKGFLAVRQERILIVSLLQRRWIIAFPFTEQSCRLLLAGGPRSLMGVKICCSYSGAWEAVLGIWYVPWRAEWAQRQFKKKMEGYCSFCVLMEERKLSDEPKIPVAYFLQIPCIGRAAVFQPWVFSLMHWKHGIYRKAPFRPCSSFVVYHSFEMSVSSVNLFDIYALICFLQPWKFLLAYNLKKNYVIFLLLSAKSAGKILMKMTVGKRYFLTLVPYPW